MLIRAFKRVRKMIPYGKQDINQDDIDAVTRILQSDYLTQGPAGPAFESAIKEYCNASFAVSVNSATSALHISCLALGVGPDDYVWTSPVTFVASANCALYCGAKIDFADIDKDTYNLSVEALERKLQEAEQAGTLPKVVIPVHLSGQSCDMESIYALSKKYKFKIIEDASHAIGAKYQGEAIGGGQFSDITVFSFHPVKIITTAEGGVAVTNDPVLAESLFLLRSHGVTRDQVLMENVSDGPWYYEQVSLGFNYRMTDLQAALGLSQMQRLDGFVNKRHEIAERYYQLLDGLPVISPFQSPDSFSSFHLYIIRLKLDEIKLSHKAVFEKLRSRGIGVNLHYIPVHLQPYYQKKGFKDVSYPIAEKYYEEAISLPLHPSLSAVEVEKVVSVLRDILWE